MSSYKVSTWLMLIIVLLVGRIENKSLVKQSGEVKDDDECNLPANVIEDIASYENVTNMIIEYVTNGEYKGRTWSSLAEFVDKYGPRLSGTQVLEDSIDYVVNLLHENELENIHTEDVEVPYWNRGEESVTLIKPRFKILPMLGLGFSIATPSEGITAEVIVVKSFEELNQLGDDLIRGKILVYNQPFITYSESTVYRSKGAIEAAKRGAVASLIRSIAPFSIATPHTGYQDYQENVTKIPTAAITPEDADQLWRMQERNETLVINFKMSATLETRVSRNTIAQLTGSELKEKVVVVSGHIDSWDVGDNAMDDGGGTFISWIAPTILKRLNLRPRRTLRSILWTDEEVGLTGAKAYELAHRDENDNLNFVMESDFGTFSPLGIVYAGSKQGECIIKEILKLFSSIGADQFRRGNPGPDLEYWVAQGVPGGGLMNANDKYFWFHHTEGDTMSVLDPDDLDRCTAFWAAFSYVVADLIHDIPREQQ